MEVLPNQSTNGQEQEALPPGGSKLHRISEHAKAIVSDTQAWVDLKLKLTQLQMKREIDERLNRLIVNVIVAVFAGLAGFFALFTGAFALGAWLGHPAWGFLIITVILMLLAGIVRAAKPHLIRVAQERAAVDEKELSQPTSSRESSESTL